MSVRPSVRPSVRRSVRPSVRPSVTRFFESSKTRILTAKMDGIELVATRGDEGGGGDDAGVVVRTPS